MLSTVNVPVPSLEKQLEVIDKAEELEKEIVLAEKELLVIDQEKKRVIEKYLF